jgi:NADH dehydrogenase FAD-containing subunit
MITEGPTLLVRMPPRFESFSTKIFCARKTAEEYLKKKNVNIVFGERVDLEKIRSLNKYTTSSGKTYEADLVLNMVGIQPNTKFMKRNFPTLLDEWGFIKVNQFLQMDGYSNIFVVGDCNNRKVLFLLILFNPNYRKRN